MVLTVPTNAPSGLISVTTDGGTALTASYFFVLPTLSISPDTIRWSRFAEDFSLETATGLTGVNWEEVTNAPVLIGNEYSVPLDAAGPRSFYRLIYR